MLLCEIFVNGSRPPGAFASRSGVILDCEFDGDLRLANGAHVEADHEDSCLPQWLL